MTKLDSKKWGAALGAVVLTTVGSLPQARAELVYENGAPARIEDRNDLRQALNASEKAQVTVQGAPQPVVVQTLPAQPQVQVQAPAPVIAPATAPTQSSVQQVVIPQQLTLTGTASNTNSNSNLNDDSTGNMSKTELMRRSRMREEVKNEDTLQERLEELRLRDEQRRTNQLLGAPGLQTSVVGNGNAAVTTTAVQEQTVVVPVTERPGVEEAPVITRRASPRRVSTEPVLVSESETRASLSSDYTDESDRMSIAVQPRFGISTMDGGSGALGYYDIHGRFGAGVGLTAVTSDNVSLELGYTYSEYGIVASSANPAAAYFQNANGETLALKQNVFDAGLKFHLLGQDSRLRPFIAGGGGYSRSYLNYDDRILSYLRQTTGFSGPNDYSVSQFLGYLGAGLDVKVSRKIAAGVGFKYYHVLSANENASLNPYAVAAPYNAVALNPISPDQQAAGGSLAHSDFYSILGTVTFTF